MIQLKVLTYNIAHGRGQTFNQMLLKPGRITKNLDSIAEIIQSIGADIVGLQEVDGPSNWSGGINQVVHLAKSTNYPFSFRGEHSRMKIKTYKIDYGTALLSVYPLLDTDSTCFQQNKRDTKGMVSAKIQVPGFADSIHVTSLHLDFLSRKVREQQLEVAIESLQHIDGPQIVLGDFNCTWKSNRQLLSKFMNRLNLQTYDPEKQILTYPSRKPRKRIDWILVSRHVEIVRYYTLNHPASDHLPVIAELIINETN